MSSVALSGDGIESGEVDLLPGVRLSNAAGPKAVWARVERMSIVGLGKVAALAIAGGWL